MTVMTNGATLVNPSDVINRHTTSAQLPADVVVNRTETTSLARSTTITPGRLVSPDQKGAAVSPCTSCVHCITGSRCR